MDPIEKLLSDLTPARAPDRLDRTMASLFDSANRRARTRRIFRSAAALALTLAAGLGIGYGAGRSSVPHAPSEITYVLPAPPAAPETFFDYSNQGEQFDTGSVRMSVSIRPLDTPDPSGTDRGI